MVLAALVANGAIAFEAYAFVKANDERRRRLEAYGWSDLAEAFGSTSDVTTLTALREDAIAIGGAVLALVGIVLTRAGRNYVYDAVSAALSGRLLMGVALALAWGTGGSCSARAHR